MVDPRVDEFTTVTEYRLSMIPPEIDNYGEQHHWDIKVVWRGGDRWAVMQDVGRWCLSRDGEWSYESIPSERTDEWKAAHRFDLDTALKLAREQLQKVAVNGKTAEGYIAWYWATFPERRQEVDRRG